MKVKVFLEEGETLTSAHEQLYKALKAQSEGEVHSDDFQDPGTIDAAQRMVEAHEEMWEEMLAEIESVLEA